MRYKFPTFRRFPLPFLKIPKLLAFVYLSHFPCRILTCLSSKLAKKLPRNFPEKKRRLKVVHTRNCSQFTALFRHFWEKQLEYNLFALDTCIAMVTANSKFSRYPTAFVCRSSVIALAPAPTPVPPFFPSEPRSHLPQTSFTKYVKFSDFSHSRFSTPSHYRSFRPSYFLSYDFTLKFVRPDQITLFLCNSRFLGEKRPYLVSIFNKASPK